MEYERDEGDKVKGALYCVLEVMVRYLTGG